MFRTYAGIVKSLTKMIDRLEAHSLKQSEKAAKLLAKHQDAYLEHTQSSNTAKKLKYLVEGGA